MSLDEQEKLISFQNSTFPTPTFGAINAASKKLFWIKRWVKIRTAELVTRWYFEFVYETRAIPSYIRFDKSSETVTIATMHIFLRRQQKLLKL